MTFITAFFQFLFHLNQHLASYVAYYGAWVYVVMFVIIFCETGLVVTAIMPGDSLLFAAGIVAASGALNIYVLLSSLIIAAFLGNISNYWIGKEFGHWLFRNEKSKIFKKSYLDRTHTFCEKYGAKTIVIARFMPIIRTFAPFVAGMGEMNYWKFMAYNLAGALFWVLLVVGGSYLFGNIPTVKDHFSLVIILIIIASIMPPIVEFSRIQLKKRMPGKNGKIT